MKALLFALLALPSLSFGADKILNGGGIWICETADLTISNSVLVDFYEAENEFKWTLIQPTRSNPDAIVDDVAASVRIKFPAQADAWARVLVEMRSHFDKIAGEITEAEDSKYRAKPLPSLCRTGGGWHYRQFANWDDRSNHGIIRQDYWASPQISALDKAGLIWHEVVYRWLRVQYGDKDSTRAREIVGVLFAENNSTFTLAQAQARLQEILQRKPPVDPGQEGSWMCAVEQRNSHFWFEGYGEDRATAQAKAQKSCQESGDFMGFMCVGMGIDYECGQLSDDPNKSSCTLNYRNNGDQKFSSTGRSILEARIKVLKACGEAVGKDNAWLCSSRDTLCQ